MKYLKYFENITDVSHSKLSSLRRLKLPSTIDGDLFCNNNKIKSLEFCPERVGGIFNCSDNKLTSLRYSPKYVGEDFICFHNNIKTLEYGPEYVGGGYYCSTNALTSLEFCSNIINGDFNCQKNKLTSLEFCPKIIKGDFVCSNNKLTSLDFMPDYIEYTVNCSFNDWINPIPYELIKKHNISYNGLYNREQQEKFGSYEYQKEFLTESPEKYKDLEYFEFDPKIKEEFDWLFNATDMGLM